MEMLDPVFVVTGVSFSCFRLLNVRLKKLVPAPSSAQRNPWKWRNIWTSLVHSLLTGAGALFGFYQHPDMAEDLISTHSRFSHWLVAVSVGYFIHDFLDMLQNQKLHQSWELLFHHTVVITCFGISIVLHRYVGFSMVALLVEINSIFLHLRQIFLMSNQLKTTLYRLNSLLNLGSYVIFRISTLAWMTRWLVLNRENIPLLTYTIGSVGMAVMTVMNIVLFYRLLRSDFLKSTREKDK